MPDPRMAIAYWLGTYLVHSTVLLGLAWVCDRFRLLRSPARREQAWRAALAGSLLTATLQTAGLTGPTPRLDLLSFRPTLAEPAPVAETGSELKESEPSSRVPLAAPEPPPDPLRSESGLRLPRLAPLVWLTGAVLLLIRLLLSAERARRHLRSRTPATPEVTSALDRLCAEVGVAPPPLSMAAGLPGPVALPNGEIVLPTWIERTLDDRQRRAVLAHELAHQVRRDPLWLVALSASTAVFWLQPLQVLARRRLAALAEFEADAWAARRIADPRALVESLAACAERLVGRHPEAWSATLVPAVSPTSPLLERIDRLLKGTPMSDSNSAWPVRLCALLILGCAALLLPGCGSAEFDLFGGGHSTSISISDDGDTHLSLHRTGYSMRMTCDGKATFAEDESDVATLTPGGEFVLTEKSDGHARTYRVRADDAGAIERTFKVDGSTVAADAAARAWLAGALPRLFRESGWDAEARAERLLARGGPERLLQEVEAAAGAHSRAAYLGALLGKTELDAAQFQRALESAVEIDSDFELRTALEKALATQHLAGDRLVALLHAAHELDSDFELRSVLERVAPRGGEPEVAQAYLEAAGRLSSDFERRTALLALLEQNGLDATALAGVLDLTNTLSSDFEKRTVLTAIAKRVVGDSALQRRYREIARGMSEFERGQALTALDDAMPS